MNGQNLLCEHEDEALTILQWRMDENSDETTILTVQSEFLVGIVGGKKTSGGSLRGPDSWDDTWIDRQLWRMFFFFRLYSRFLRSKPLVLPSFGSMKSSIAMESPMFSLLKSQECFDRPRRASCDFCIMRTWSIWLQINPPIAISMLKTWANSESALWTRTRSHQRINTINQWISQWNRTEWASRHRTPKTLGPTL